MLFNMWYVAADLSEISDKPKHVKVLGQSLVLFKDQTGKVVCLSDICVHRGASLSAGKVVDGCIQCPYHGWRFNHEGAATKIPAQKEGVKIPRRARVDAYPVVIKYDWVWVFMGDLPEAERPPLPEFPEYNHPEWRMVRGEYTWNADYARVIENGLDFSHAPFVHPSFGDPDHAVIEDFEVQGHEWGAHATVTYLPPMYKGIWRLLRRERTPVRANPSFHMSGGLMCLKVHITKTWTQIIYDVNTPVDENTTHTRWIHARNFMKFKWADKDTIRRVEAIFVQDAAVVEKIQPQLLPVDLSEELSIKSDGLQIAYRRMRRNLIKKGWSIDVDHFKEKQNIKRARVIPSPERSKKENSDIDWVLPEVPVQQFSALQKASNLSHEDVSMH
ncbi:MAG: aromatic ring-hydroxylating dioxygenase subunit alpha [Proteobacteria bacterium]|nr:aromatic ring-hydroxylating dioxygenase subunit alpha [Pseudomonadota bacterium]